jgi:hypothetical protein
VKKPLLTLACTLLATHAAAKEPATLRYKPPSDEERPVVVEATVQPQGSDIALRLRFDKPPFGKECGNRCANATLWLDTDANSQTGLQLPGKAAETGADMALILQGAREYTPGSNDGFLRVKVRHLASDARTVEDGNLLAELDHRKDPERIYIEGKTVFLLIDATAATLPSGRKLRLIYHPPGSKALVGTAPGLLGARSGGKTPLFRPGSERKKP